MDMISLQTGKGQDYAVFGRVRDSDYIAVFDGHGFDKCIDYVRTLNMDEIMGTENPARTLWDLVERGGNFYESGTTLTMARITGTMAELWNIGDSQTHVFLNGEHVYTTDIHTFLNPTEVERTKPLIHFIQSSKAPFPVSDTRVENVESPIGYFKMGESIVPSQSLGHNGMTNFAPSYKQIQFAPTDKVRIVAGSDGLFDMLVDVRMGTAKELAEEAERRWRQEWEFFDGKRSYKTNYGGCIDDISCAIWEN
jgi:serine/threonine protein phosphatase PrpC